MFLTRPSRDPREAAGFSNESRWTMVLNSPAFLLALLDMRNVMTVLPL